MPVTVTETLSAYAGNGSTTTPYPITIPRDRDEDLRLLVNDEPSTDFSISPDGFRTGVAYTNEDTLVLFRRTPRTQIQPFPSNTTPAAEDVRAGFDKLTLSLQEVDEEVSRAVKSPLNGSFQNSSTLGVDEQGQPISRSSEEQVEHLGLGGRFDEAASNAIAATEAANSSGQSALLAQQAARDAAEKFEIFNSAVANLTPATGRLSFNSSANLIDRIVIGSRTYNFRSFSDSGPYPPNTILFNDSASISNRDWAFAFFQAVNGSITSSSPSIPNANTPNFRSANITGPHPEVSASFTPSFNPNEGIVNIEARQAGTAGNTLDTLVFSQGANWLANTLTGGQDASSPILTYDSVDDIPVRLFGIVNGELYFQFP